MSLHNVILRVNSDIYKKYRIYCKNKGVMVSRLFENQMENQLKRK